MRAIDKEIAELRATDLWVLKQKVDDVDKEGKDMLTEMVVSIESRIVKAKSRLESLTKTRAK